MLCTFLGKLIGENHKQTYNNIDSFFSNFNKSRECKLLIELNEVKEKGSAHDNHDLLKSTITEETIKVEPKGRESYNVNNYARIIINTNNPNAVRMDADDRRTTAHACSNRKANDGKYFVPIWAEVNSTAVCRSAFEYFAERKYDRANVFRAYSTVYKNHQKTVNRPHTEQCLINMIENKFESCGIDDFKEDGQVIIAVSDTRAKYRSWCEEYGTKYRATTMKTQLSNIGIADPMRRTMGDKRTLSYSFDISAIRLHMQKVSGDPTWDFSYA